MEQTPAVTTARDAKSGVQTDNRIVVGVDESASARLALQWALDESRRRGWRCQVVEVWAQLVTGVAEAAATRESLERHLAALVDEACCEMEATSRPDMDVLFGDPVEVLAAAAWPGDLLVVGSRGHGALKDMVLGSVSAELVHLGVCPTIVIPPGASVDGHNHRVVVGVDGSDASGRALRWAATEALLRHCELVVVHAWHMPVAMGSMYAPTVAVPYQECRDAAQEFLDQMVSHLREGTGITVVARLAEGAADHELVSAAGGADLLVVGSRGRREVAATVLGSISRGCVHHSPCPVAVIA